MVTTTHLKTGEEELKINLESHLNEKPEKKLNSSTNMDFINSKALRSSFTNVSTSNQKINDKHKNFGFNSFIGSGNTPQDLKMQSSKKARYANAAGNQSLVVSEKHLLNQSNGGNPMRDRLMTEFLKKKIGPQRYEVVEQLLQNSFDPQALLKNPS